MKREFEDVVEELSRMSPDDIHNLLKVNGIKGKLGDGCSCPIANYIIRECGLTSIHVGTRITPDFQPGMSVFAPEGVDTPRSVRDFIEAFDGSLDDVTHGPYAELIQEEES